MQQFTVPQFIDVEDKIFGPITTRQFLVMLVGFMLIGVSYKLFDFSMFLFVGIIIFAFSGILAFLRINGMPFHFFILNFVQTIKMPGLRVWNNAIGKINAHLEAAETKVKPGVLQLSTKGYSTSRLSELSLIVDTSGAYRGEDGDGQDKIQLAKRR